LRTRLGERVQRNAEGARLSVKAESAEAAAAALTALTAAGFALADFSMGTPSLEEVFFALTGQMETLE
jgi:ABC-2 type transport system ATP-binding protein